MKNTTTITCGLILVGIFLLGTKPALGQTTGHLKGRISDSSGGAIANAHIIVERPSGIFEATGNDNGEFDLTLPVGTYNVSTKKVPGFVPFSRNKVQVKPGKDTILKVKLKVTFVDASCVLYITDTPIKKKEVEGKKKGKN